MLRRYLPLSGPRGRLNYAALIAILVLVALLHSLPSLKSRLSPRADQHVDDRPQYLHQSVFRVNPDSDYERQLSDALRNVEHQEWAVHGGGEAPQTIWQILLGHEPSPEERGEDSINFEAQNADWTYKVSTFPPILLAWGDVLAQMLNCSARYKRMGRRIHCHHPLISAWSGQPIPLLPSRRLACRLIAVPDFVVFWRLLCRHRHLPQAHHQSMPITTEISVQQR